MLLSLVSERFGYLLVSIEREVELENMMPHSVSFNDAVQHFGNNCTHLIHLHVFFIQARIAQLVAYRLGTGRSWVQIPAREKIFQ